MLFIIILTLMDYIHMVLNKIETPIGPRKIISKKKLLKRQIPCSCINDGEGWPNSPTPSNSISEV